jgi:ATP synthase subunit 6
MLYSPLEQFQIISIFDFKFGNVILSFTNSTLFLLLSIFVIVSLVHFSTLHATIIPNRWQSIVELIFEFTVSMVNENIGKKGIKYFPLVFTIFILILICNLLGMVPYTFTVTSHLIVTFGLALMMWIGITIIGFVKHGINFFSFFAPPGAPLALAPLLVIIELISYFFRSLSLSIRLFANMMAGHTLFKIVSGFAFIIINYSIFCYAIGILPMGILFGFTFLEIGVAILQAYVFTILICIYLNDSIYLH